MGKPASKVDTRVAAPLCITLLALAAAGGGPVESKDPLATEIKRWIAFLVENKSKDELWIEVSEVIGVNPVSVLGSVLAYGCIEQARPITRRGFSTATRAGRF